MDSSESPLLLPTAWAMAVESHPLGDGDLRLYFKSFASCKAARGAQFRRGAQVKSFGTMKDSP
jgi:hypothetical protein